MILEFVQHLIHRLEWFLSMSEVVYLLFVVVESQTKVTINGVNGRTFASFTLFS